MNDLLTQDSFGSSKDRPLRKEVDIEMGKWAPQKYQELGLEAFFKQVQEIEKLLDKLSTLLHRLQEANEESKTVTKASSMKSIKQRMANDVDDVGKVAGSIRIKLEEIDRENISNRQKPGCGKGTSVDRSRMVTTAALKKKLTDRMADFQVLRQTIQSEYREVIERRVFTVTGAKPDEEMIDNLIETGIGEQIFQKAFQEMGRVQVLDTLEEIQERHETVKEIERKLLDLHQIFMDMAVLVEAQGEILDSIENQVMNAVEHVQSGADALHSAKQLQKKSRKCMLISVVVLLVIALIIVLSIIKPWRK